jgi:parallel beta-helix repeat protein
MKRLTAFLSASLILWLCAGVSATVLHVPSEYPTIQAGIDAAGEGDTVLVADGTYTGDGNRDLDFGGVNMVVMSENGPEATTIDCEASWLDPHRGFYFHSGEDSSSIVQGFAIENGFAAGSYPESCGGAIYCGGSSPTIVDNTITASTALDDGGGIYCDASSPTVEGNMIADNMAHDSGGGIYCSASSPAIVNNTITANMAVDNGGGIHCDASSPTVEGNTIAENECGSQGAGICCLDNSAATIVNNTIRGNVATNGLTRGGGIYCLYSPIVVVGNLIAENTARNAGGIWVHYSAATIRNNMIVENTCEWSGGGLHCSYPPSAIVTGNTITRNTTAHGGGGLSCYESSPTIEHNTITENTGGTCGGGIYCSSHSSPTITANTIANNTAINGGGIDSGYSSSPTVINSILWADSASVGQEIYIEYSSSVTVSYSDVAGGSLAVHVEPGCMLVWGEGNIDADPEFVLAEKRDYRLLWGSPCVDAGHPDSLDPDGTRSDMGAHFFDQDDYMTLYLTPDETEVVRGGVLGVTYTAINRWAQPEPFWVLTEAILPNGNPLPVMGPDRYVLPAETTVQRHLTHNVPGAAPLGEYRYGSRIGIPPATLYDEDSFTFTVLEP